MLSGAWYSLDAELQHMGLSPGKFASLSNGKTHYHIAGPESGPVIVFFHVRTSRLLAVLEPLVERCVNRQHEALEQAGSKKEGNLDEARYDMVMILDIVSRCFKV